MQNLVKRETIEIWVVSIATIIAVCIMVFVFPVPEGKVYDCSLAEISPDYPIKVKNECRKIRAENFNKDLQKPK